MIKSKFAKFAYHQIRFKLKLNSISAQYVLLIKNIVRMTLPTHSDKMGLQRAIEGLHTVLSAVDKATGRAKVFISKFLFKLFFSKTLNQMNTPMIERGDNLDFWVFGILVGNPKNPFIISRFQ